MLLIGSGYTNACDRSKTKVWECVFLCHLSLSRWLKGTDGNFLSLGLQHASRFSAATLSSQLLSFGLEIMPGLVSLRHSAFPWLCIFYNSHESVFRVPMSESCSNSSLLRNASLFISANMYWETHFAVTELKFLLKIGRFQKHEELSCIEAFYFFYFYFKKSRFSES